MLNRKTVADVVTRLRRRPSLLIFVVPPLVFLGLLYFRQLASERPPIGNGDQVPAGSTEVSSKKKPTGADWNMALLEPLRSKIVRAKPPESAPTRCAVSDPKSGVFTVGEEETPILLGPSQTAKPLREWSGVQRFLDPRHDLKIIEESGAWVRVSVVSPNWPPGDAGWSGWIEKKNIQKLDGPEAKHCFFVDLGGWSGLPANVQSAARTAALQILRQDERCRRISRGGFLGNGQRFYLTCYPNDGAKPYHYWLTATNLRKDFATPAVVDEDTAMSKCRGELQKTLSGRALVEGKEAVDPQIETFQARRVGSVYQISIDFRLGAAEMQKAFCLLPPGSGAEITLGNPSGS